MFYKNLLGFLKGWAWEFEKAYEIGSNQSLIPSMKSQSEKSSLGCFGEETNGSLNNYLLKTFYQHVLS